MGCRASASRNRESSHGSRAASLGVSASPNTNADTRRAPKNWLSTSLRRSSRREAGVGKANSGRTRNGEPGLQQCVYTQDDNPLAPPPPLSSEMVHQGNSTPVRSASPTSGRMSRIPSFRRHPSDSAPPRVKGGVSNHDSAVLERLYKERPESHFDPLLMPDVLHLQESTGSRVASSSLPSRPSSCVATLDSEDHNATFRTEIDSHDKTDSAQAAKEYQQHVQARRSAQAAHTKRRQLEEFDPVRPMDSFNVTHRGLLGRCWDRRGPELIPVSFVHALEAALRAAEEIHPASTTTSHPPGAETGRDEFMPVSPRVALSQPMPCSPRGGGLGGRRVPRCSHWFSVGGVSCDTMCPPVNGSGLGSQAGASIVSSYCMNSGVSSPITSWPGASGPGFPLTTSSPALSRAGAAVLRSKAKSFMATAASSPAVYGGAIDSLSDDRDSDAAKPRQALKAEPISALPMEKREQYYNDFLTRNPLFMGIKDGFAFRLSDGVSEDPTTKFLRKRNLEPAPGVVAMRWNRVEFFHPTLHTLIRAVAMTQGMTLNVAHAELLQQASGTGARQPGMQHSRLSPSASTNHMLHVTGEEGGAIAEMLLRHSFSQYVLSHIESGSFSRGSGSLNNSFLSQSDKLRGTGDGSGSHLSNSLLSPPRNRTRRPDKDGNGEAGAFAAAKFPEDSVLALALCIPSSRLPSLMGALPPPQLSGVGRSSSYSASAAALKTSRDGDGSPAASPGPSGAPHAAFTRAGSDGSVLVAFSVSSFSVSIDPFRWQEHRYIRYPIDIDDSKKSSRHTYGEGVVTDVMYGGIMFVEGSSFTAVKELQTLLADMTWTEGRTLSGVVGDVRKYLKLVQGNGNKVRQATAPQQQQQKAEEQNSHRYRICSRVGGRPMRDAVELQEISYYLDDVEVREEIVTLNPPIRSDDVTAAKGAAAGPGGETGSSAGCFESKHACHGNSLAADPDVSPSFSRVASVWVTLPVIAAVLRTWGLHLLSNPEFAQPTALLLQKYAGIAPVLQTTALGALHSDNDTPSEEVGDDVDYLFFEGGGPAVTVPAAAAVCATHPQPAPRIPKFNCFYASKSSTPLLAADEHHTSHPGAASHSPANMHRSSNVALDEQGANGADENQPSLKKLGEDTCDGLGPKSQSPEALKGEATHLADSVNSLCTASEAKLGGDEQSSHALSFIDTEKDQCDSVRGKSCGTKRKRVVGKRSGAANEGTEGAPRTLQCGSRGNKAKPNRATNRKSVSTRPATRCNSPLSPRSGTRPQSRRSDADCDQGSPTSSSSSSSFPSFPAAMKAGTNDFQGNLSSLVTSSCNKLHQSAFQSVSHSRLGRSTSAPSPSTPAARGEDTLRTSVPPTPLLTAVSSFTTLPTLSALTFDGAPVEAASAEPSVMASTVGPESSAAAVASGKKMGPDAVQEVSQVAFRSPHFPREPKTHLTMASSGVNSRGAEMPLTHRDKATAAPSTVSAAAAPSPPLSLPLKVRRVKIIATPTTTTAPKGTSAAAIVAMTTKLRGVTATSTCRKVSGPVKRAPVLIKHAQISVTHFVESEQRARDSPPSPGASVLSTGITVNSAETSAAYRATDDEEEEMWHMAMLEVKAQQQELEELRQARRDAEDAAKQREGLLRSLNRILLPHTAPQELGGVLLYLKTAIYEPEDMPHGRLFLQQPSWLPMLVAVWTAPANRIRSVEIAAELTWVDIPRLGLVAGLLYHQYASGPLEELIIRADKLLGSPQATATLPNNSGSYADLADKTAARPRKPRLLAGRSRKSKHGNNRGRSAGANRGRSNLNFTTELDQVTSGFGPGCPPFLVTPEEARDTLWLLLCSVAANMRAPTFRVVLCGLPTGEISAAASGSGAGRVRSHGRGHTPFTYLASFFDGAVSRFRNEHDDAQLLLKSRSMVLDNFVVCPGSRLGSDRDMHSAAQRSDSSCLGTSTTHHNAACDEGQLVCTNSSLQLDEDGTAWLSSMSERKGNSTLRQTLSLVIMSLPAAVSADMGGAACSSDGHRCNSNNTFAAVRPVVAPTPCTGEAFAGVSISGGVDGTARAIEAVQTHRHRVQRHRAWVRNGNDVEERPFYELLVHRCDAVEEATATTENDTDDARFYAEPDRQQRLQEAVSQSEAPPRLWQSPPPSPLPRHLPGSGFAHGLRTAEDEQVALQSEVAALRERAGDIWEALRKSVKHYNQLQMEAYHKAMKQNGGSQSPLSPPPQPPRQIVLEY
ncbi:conserved hypothetical protein [Leishmania major strain Friedlin]|uniref:Uncharacterized protein n=1 Tax=Leishmania major TaxID=5664 RepID=Q4QEP0_LEIMA|nr:conserved hypothetical protein [Leishmania major strain Friedlin]CAG9572168.1 hypothetical_protein_-_conserved [Leishmania major strain Friedlin]CAJ03968.1 conserved hypothetical protein [Leishmania major strain Friedlin]|eukprot:XP_001682208.1 conserved hypothetical protein [Leishmania major strain Friedlin]